MATRRLQARMRYTKPDATEAQAYRDRRERAYTDTGTVLPGDRLRNGETVLAATARNITTASGTYDRSKVTVDMDASPIAARVLSALGATLRASTARSAVIQTASGFVYTSGNVDEPIAMRLLPLLTVLPIAASASASTGGGGRQRR